MRRVDAARIRCLKAPRLGLGIEDLFAEAFNSESPTHRWCAPVRRTLRSHRSGQRWSFVAGSPELRRAVSGCLVPAATFFHVPLIGCLPPVLLRVAATSCSQEAAPVRGSAGDHLPADVAGIEPSRQRLHAESGAQRDPVPVP